MISQIQYARLCIRFRKPHALTGKLRIIWPLTNRYQNAAHCGISICGCHLREPKAMLFPKWIQWSIKLWTLVLTAAALIFAGVRTLLAEGVPVLQTLAEIPSDNPQTSEKIALGEKLFFEPRLSADGTVACASCHDPDRAFTDGRPVGSIFAAGNRCMLK